MKLIERLDMYLDEGCPGDKKKSKGKGKGLGKGKGKGPIGRFKDDEDEEDEEELDEADATKFVAYMNDPLYKAVLTSKNKKDFNKSLNTLKSIRGESAFNDFLRMLKK